MQHQTLKKPLAMECPALNFMATWFTLLHLKIILGFMRYPKAMKLFNKNFLFTKQEKVRYNFRWTSQCLWT
jgi:hypothetical protein